MFGRIRTFLGKMKSEALGPPPVVIHDPNDPPFLSHFKRTPSEHMLIWKKATAQYMDSWKSLDAQRAEKDARWERTLQDNKAAMEQIAKDTAWATETAPDSMKKLINEYVIVYKETLRQFGSGYKEGVASSKSALDLAKEAIGTLQDMAQQRQAAQETSHGPPPTAQGSQQTTQESPTPQHLANKSGVAVESLGSPREQTIQSPLPDQSRPYQTPK